MASIRKFESRGRVDWDCVDYADAGQFAGNTDINVHASTRDGLPP